MLGVRIVVFVETEEAEVMLVSDVVWDSDAEWWSVGGGMDLVAASLPPVERSVRERDRDGELSTDTLSCRTVREADCLAVEAADDPRMRDEESGERI